MTWNPDSWTFFHFPWKLRVIGSRTNNYRGHNTASYFHTFIVFIKVKKLQGLTRSPTLEKYTLKSSSSVYKMKKCLARVKNCLYSSQLSQSWSTLIDIVIICFSTAAKQSSSRETIPQDNPLLQNRNKATFWLNFHNFEPKTTKNKKKDRNGGKRQSPPTIFILQFPFKKSIYVTLNTTHFFSAQERRRI